MAAGAIRHSCNSQEPRSKESKSPISLHHLLYLALLTHLTKLPPLGFVIQILPRKYPCILGKANISMEVFNTRISSFF